MLRKLTGPIAAGAVLFHNNGSVETNHVLSMKSVSDAHQDPTSPQFFWEDDEIGQLLTELAAIHAEMGQTSGEGTLEMIREMRDGGMYVFGDY